MHIRKVLVPVDFSPPSSFAIGHGIALARRFKAKLMLFHVIEPSVALTYTFPTESEKADKARYEQAERMLGALVGPEDQDDLDLEIAVRMGDIEEQISSAIHEFGADIVVMGTHGRKLVSRWLIGSVTQALLRKLPVPILTVCHVARPLSFSRILFATDFSDLSKEGLHFVLDLAGSMKSDLVAAHVIERRPPVTYETPQVATLFDEERRRALDEARSAFARIESEAKGRNIKVETVVAEGIPAEAIVRIADENAVDFIVVSVRKKGRLERTLMGTTAERLIREAHVPVLSIPAHAAMETEDRTKFSQHLAV